MGADIAPDSNPLGLVTKTLGAPLEAGNIGVIIGRAGVGKTAFLTHIALEHMMLYGKKVLHVCIDEVVDKIKVWYREFLKNIVALQSGEDMAGLQRRTEPLRFILAYLHHTFNPSKLEQSIMNLREQAHFEPSVLILDGLDFDHVTKSDIQELLHLAVRHSVGLWMSARTHRHISITNERGVPYPCHEMDDLFHAILYLEPEPETVRVSVIKQGENYRPAHADVILNPQTYLIP